MPGPCASKPYTKHDAKPNRKSARRLAARLADFDRITDQTALRGMTRPGSQNRNKK